MTDGQEIALVCLGSVAAIAALIAVAIAVSRPTHEITTGPDGLPGILVQCSSPGGCISEASVACPRGYDVLNSEEKHGTSTSYVYTGSKNSGVAVPIQSDTFEGARLIRCKP